MGKIKRFYLSLFTLIFLITLPSTVFAYTFKDVTKNNFFYEDVKYLNEKGYIPGDAYFYPQNYATREDVINMFVKALDLPIPEEYVPLKDVSDLHPSAPNVQKAIAAGLLHGFHDQTFRLSAPVTRAQLVLIIDRAFDYEKSRQKKYAFTDIPKYTKLYDAVMRTSYPGIVRGTSTYRFSPDLYVTRGQAAAMIARAFRYEESKTMEGTNFPMIVGDRKHEIAPGEYILRTPYEHQPLSFLLREMTSVGYGPIIHHDKGLPLRQTYISLEEGQQITFNGQLTPVEKYKPRKYKKIEQHGTYKVGYDLEPGVYVVTPYASYHWNERPQLQVFEDANQQELIFESFEDYYIYEVKLEEGQYVHVVYLHLEKWRDE